MKRRPEAPTGEFVLLNLSPLPANVTPLPSPEGPATVNAGFQAVMSRQYDNTPTPAGAVTATAEVTGAADAEAGIAEMASDADDVSGVEALIGEMLQRQEVATPAGNGVPLAVALESLTDALAGLAEAVAMTGGSLAVTGQDPVASDTGDDTAAVTGSGVPATLAGLPAGLAPVLQQIVTAAGRLDTRADGTPSGVQRVVSDVLALVDPLRQALGQVEPGEAEAVPAGGAPTGQRVTSDLMTTTRSLVPAGVTMVDPGSLPDPDALEATLAAIRAQAGSVAETGVDTARDVSPAPLLLQAADRVVEVEPGSGAAAPLADGLVSTPPLPGKALPDVASQFLPADAAGSPEPAAEPLLDPGFELVADASRPVRESTGRDVMLEAVARLANPAESRSPALDTVQELATQADRTPNAAEPRGALATGKADVWMQQPAELPEHILHHVGRLHAQSVRLHAAGFTDLVQRLTLSLHPEDLGQVDVQMRTGEQLSVTFLAREGATRDLLEQNLPRLRQLFESQGLSLGDVNVGAGNTQARQEGGDGRDPAGKTGQGSVDAPVAQGGIGPGRRSSPPDRLIDIRA